MRKIKEVLRLRHELGLAPGTDSAQFARSAKARFTDTWSERRRPKLVWPLPEDWDDAKIEQLLFPVKVGFKAATTTPIDFAGIHQDLVSQKVSDAPVCYGKSTKQSNPEGYQYSWFCQRYPRLAEDTRSGVAARPPGR